MQINGRTPGEMLLNMRKALLRYGYTIETEDWQGKDKPPEFLELLQLSGECSMMQTPEEMQSDLNPLLPWSDIHFEERVGGKPLNPDPSHEQWLPGNSDYKMDEAKFSHTYSERLWASTLYTGIRFKVGDLNSAANLLKQKPNTRQLVVPMYMHEDLEAARMGERVPCSLSWNFILRGGSLHCTYTMRSVDAIRHAHNDLYLAQKLALWLIHSSGIKAKLGRLAFSATSFHCFKNDTYTLRKLTGVKNDRSI